MRTLPVVLALAAMAGCAELPDYYYSPENATVHRGGLPAQVTQIPQESPQGTIEVVSSGIQRIRPRGAQEMLALHVRLIVDNEGNDQPWSIDTRQQLVEVTEGQSRAMFVNTPTAAGPIVTIARRERVSFDLYFPLPPGAHEPSQLPTFDVLWQVQTPLRTISGRARFHRLEREYYADYGPYYYGYGAGAWPYWWYDPYYPSLYYAHGPVVYGYPHHHHH